MKQVIFKDSMAVSIALWFVFSFVALAGIFAESSNMPLWLSLFSLALAAVLFLWRQPRVGVYVEGSTLILQGVVRTRRIPICEIASIEKPERGRLRLRMIDGPEIPLRVAPVAGRHRDRVHEEVALLVAEVNH